MSDPFETDDSWIEREIRRLEAVGCYCEPCAASNCHPTQGCDECDGMGVTVTCERCEQLEGLHMARSHANREKARFSSL